AQPEVLADSAELPASHPHELFPDCYLQGVGMQREGGGTRVPVPPRRLVLLLLVLLDDRAALAVVRAALEACAGGQPATALVGVQPVLVGLTGDGFEVVLVGVLAQSRGDLVADDVGESGEPLHCVPPSGTGGLPF